MRSELVMTLDGELTLGIDADGVDELDDEDVWM